MKNVKVLAVFIALISVTNVAFGAKYVKRASVLETLSAADDRFGGCAARLSVAPAPGCSTWVTFSCDEEYATKADALRNFDSALLAFALTKDVKVWVDNEKLHTGSINCFVERIDVLP